MAVTLTVGANTYVSRADATTYFEARLGASAWDDALEADQDKALVQATRAVESLTFKGRKSDVDQALAFPRCYPRDDRYYVRSRELQFDDPPYPRMICEDAVPQVVIDAVCEEAMQLLADITSDGDTNERLAMQAQGVTSWRADDIAESYGPVRKGAFTIRSVTARNLLARYLAGAVSIR